jgi:hypothetical protein
MRLSLPIARLSSHLILLALLITALPAAAKPPAAIGGSYTGEVVVRSLSGTRVVVGLDEQGRGYADRLFFVDTAQPAGPFSARSAVSRVEYTAGRLVVVVPSEQRTYIFQVPVAIQGGAARKPEQATDAEEGAIRAEPDSGFLQTIGFEVVRVDHAVQLAAYAGMRQRVTLAEVRNGSLEGIGPRSLIAASQVPLNQPPPAPDDGSGCRTACSTTCGGGSNCSITCTNGHCASCDCVTGHGASCSCS